jgi:prephenate dehydrogenase
MTLGTVAILGPGLIGGSLALALAERELAQRLMIYARSPRALDDIRAAGVAAELTGNPSEAVREADVVILCVPIEAMAELVREFRDALKPTALVTDVGSVKGSVVREIEPLLGARWIGSHPMAGSEQAGFAAARADLFEGAPVILTPTSRTPLEMEQRAAQFWRALGGRVVRLDPDLHDEYVAQISHLPHLLAAALAARVSPEALDLAGGGFRDTTRVASGSPELWLEILSSNAPALSRHLELLIRDLQNLRQALVPPVEKSLLLETLKAAHDARAKLPEKRRP